MDGYEYRKYIQEQQQTLEKTIKYLLTEFTKSTGINVNDIHVTAYHKIGKPESIEYKVDTDIRL